MSNYPTLWLIMEFADAGTLYKEISRYPNKMIPDSGIRYYTKQVLDALGYMHQRHVSHGDLHLGNVLLKYVTFSHVGTPLLSFTLPPGTYQTGQRSAC